MYDINDIRGYCVYIITNLINGKIYVGQSKRVKKRWYDHRYDSAHGKKRPLYDSMRKYGIGSFEIFVVEIMETKEEADMAEIFWVSFYGSTRRTFGYNLAVGGGGSNGYKHGKEYCIQLGNRRRGAVASPETREKIRVAASNHRHGEQAKAKLSALRGEIANHFNHSISNEEILRLNKEGLSCSEIAEQMKIGTPLVRRRLNSLGYPPPPNRTVRRKLRLIAAGKEHLISPDNDELSRLYLEEKLKCWQIGKMYEMTGSGVSSRLRIHGVPMRPKFGNKPKITEPLVPQSQSVEEVLGCD